MAKLKVSFDFKKIDLTRIKQILLHTGEKIVLGIIVVIGIWLVWGGLSSASSANKDKDGKLLVEVLKTGAKNYDMAIKGAAPPTVEKIETNRPWITILSHLAQWASYIQLSEDPDQSRRNPKILAINADVKIDFLKAGLSAYEIDIDKQKATIVIKPGGDKESGELAHTILPRRMLIVSAIFPLEEQTKAFQTALKQFHGIANEEDRPHILGVNVWKIERDPSDPKSETETQLYNYDPAKSKIAIAANLDDVFRRALPDPDALKPFTNHRKFSMLITNMPKLSSGEYPPLKNLPGFFEVKEEKTQEKGEPKKDRKKKDNKPPEKAFDIVKKPLDKVEAPLAKIDLIDWADPPADKKAAWWGGDYPIFDGQPGGDEVKKDDPKGAKIPFRDPRDIPMNPIGKIPIKGKGKDQDKEEPIDPLIRFFDVDVKPGYQYAYKIQVRLKNPNFGKGDLVALPEMADEKELLSPMTITAFTLVPSEMPLLYAVDQYYDPEPPESKDPKDAKKDPLGAFKQPDPKDPKNVKEKEPKKEKEEPKKGPQPRGPDFAKADHERAPVQIHRWFDWADKAGERGVIADWIVAERLLVRRGEYIGRPEVIVEAPTWSLQKSDFELINVMPPDDPKKKPAPGALPKPTGIRLDFTIGKSPPVLVDFEGGHRKLKSTQVEECPMELLVLTADGKLIVHNSQADTHDEQRVKRYEVYRERLVQHARPIVKEEEHKKEKDKGGFPKLPK